ncbi:Single-stranded DNA-binding protein [Cupriavidus phytorum]|uniref:Single-stranded DNA-binding protein n=1 Tax=Cupriavidus taiwanensis TaxID=164546 RepID=A0A975XE98_9BURK|nr:single-stranded DNA-binding protein [Cupriavidus taiwanensis]SOY65641.1 Single-stranded DNA-binding protein [Cupriavidus taiwanensis]
MIQLFGLARLGRDAELRSTSGGDSVASLSLAFNYGRKGDDGKKPTQWVDGSIWGKRAEALAPYLTKGSLVTVTIEDAHIETFKKSDGSEGTKLIGRVTAIDLAGGGERQAAPAPAPAPRQPQRAPAGGSSFDDDIPFAGISSKLPI